MSIDDLRFAARCAEVSARLNLSGSLTDVRLTCALLLFGLTSQLRIRSLAPIIHDPQLTRAHQAVTQAGALSTSHDRDSSLGARSLGSSAQLRVRCLRGTGGALGHYRRSLIDALVAQPMQSVEGIAVAHGRSVAKPGRLNARSANRQNYRDLFAFRRTRVPLL